jgi:hypothetical protein
MFKNSKKQGDAGLGRAIAYFTSQGYDVAVPLTDSADWDLIVEINGELKKVQVKTSSQLTKYGVMAFNTKVTGGNKSGSKPSKFLKDQSWDLLYLYHLVTKKHALIPKDCIESCDLISVGGKKYNEFLLD